MKFGEYRGRMPVDPTLDNTHGVDAPLVLVVEDNAINQLVVKRQLERLGFDCDVAETGTEALERLGVDHKYGLILMDWQLPDIDGLEVTRRYRALEASRGDRVPVVAITASGMPGDRAACREAGMDGFLSKPVGLDELGQEIQRVLPRVESSERLEVPASSDVNVTAMAELVEDLGDTGLVASLVRRYLSELTGRELRLAAALDASDLDEIHRVGHTLKSTSAMLGATELVAACRTLETVADRDHAAKVIAELASAANRVRISLTAWLDTNETSAGANE